jgi:hypothetical protein
VGMATARERRTYSPEQKAEVLAVLQANNNNLYRTAVLCKVPRKTIARWLAPQPRTERACERSGAAVAELRQRKREELATSLRALAAKLVGVVERELPNMSGKDAGITLGIVCDKLAHLEAAQEQSQERAQEDTVERSERLERLRERYARLREQRPVNDNPRSVTLTRADIDEARQLLAGSHIDQQSSRGQEDRPEQEVVESEPEGAPMTVLKPAQSVSAKTSPPRTWHRWFN